MLEEKIFYCSRWILIEQVLEELINEKSECAQPEHFLTSHSYRKEQYFKRSANVGKISIENWNRCKLFLFQPLAPCPLAFHEHFFLVTFHFLLSLRRFKKKGGFRLSSTLSVFIRRRGTILLSWYNFSKIWPSLLIT